MLIEFTEAEHAEVIDSARAAAIPGDVPAWVLELAPCPVCFNSGEACGYCGGDDAAPLPTMAEVDAQ